MYADYLPIVSGRHQSPFTRHPRKSPADEYACILKFFVPFDEKCVDSCWESTRDFQTPVYTYVVYDALILRQLRLETKYFTSEISGKITNTIASQSSPSKQSKAYGATSKARLFPAPVGADTNISLQDIFLNCFPLIVAQFGISGGLSSSVESQASLRMANFDYNSTP